MEESSKGSKLHTFVGHTYFLQEERRKKTPKKKKSKRQNTTKQIKESWAWARLQAQVRLRAWIWAWQWHGFLGSGTRSIDLRLKFFRLKRQGRFGTAATELPVTVGTHGGTEGQARGKNQNDDDVYDTWSGVGCVWHDLDVYYTTLHYTTLTGAENVREADGSTRRSKAERGGDGRIPSVCISSLLLTHGFTTSFIFSTECNFGHFSSWHPTAPINSGLLFLLLFLLLLSFDTLLGYFDISIGSCGSMREGYEERAHSVGEGDET
jgi:hypothetical protein